MLVVSIQASHLQVDLVKKDAKVTSQRAFASKVLGREAKSGSRAWVRTQIELWIHRTMEPLGGGERLAS